MDNFCESIGVLLQSRMIVVPDYQRAYSWETEMEASEDSQKQVNVFVRDLEAFVEHSKVNPHKYYLGQLLFESYDATGSRMGVIDGQQRLTTAVLFVATALRWLAANDTLSEGEGALRERLQEDCFLTPHFTRGTFYACLNRLPVSSVETCAERRLIEAVAYFDKVVSGKHSAEEVRQLLGAVLEANVTSIVIGQDCDAIQFFLFQNNRGKQLTRLELAKTILMQLGINATGAFPREAFVATFAEIFRESAKLEQMIDEDGLLHCAWCVYKGDFVDICTTADLEKAGRGKAPCDFVMPFTQLLRDCAHSLRDFFESEACQSRMIEAESLVIMRPYFWAYPVIAKCHQLGLAPHDRQRIWRVLESLTVRKRLIGRRAEMEARIRGAFQAMTKANAADEWEAVLKKIRQPAPGEWWWNYWSDRDLEETLRGEITNGSIAKHLLWRYECARVEQVAHGYYLSLRDFDRPEVEHIAPQTENNEQPGYGDYILEGDKASKGIVSGHWMWRLGNLLILSKSHNCKLGNIAFGEKLDSYVKARVASDVCEIAKSNRTQGDLLIWDSACIKTRTDRIVRLLMDIYCPPSEAEL